MSSNYGEELRSGASSPSFEEWTMEGSNRDTFEPVPLFDSNSEESTMGARTQQFEGEGEKRRFDVSFDEMPTISRRKKKAKGMPKRPMSAYALFFSRERSKLLESEDDSNAIEGGDKRLSFEELEKIIGMRWRDLSAAQKEEFESLASEDSVRYRNEMEAFNDGKKKQSLVKETDKTEPPRDQPLPPLNPSEAPSVPSIHPSMLGQGMGMYMPPPSPSASAGAPPPSGYGPPPRQAGRPSHPHHPEHYPPPYPSHSTHAYRYPNEPQPPPHYYMEHMRSSGHAPPPHPVPSAAMDRDLFPIPPGMELMLPDRDGRERKYRVQYACYTMPREAAQEYVERLSGAISRRTPPPQPPPQSARMDDANAERAQGHLSKPPAWGSTY